MERKKIGKEGKRRRKGCETSVKGQKLSGLSVVVGNRYKRAHSGKEEGRDHKPRESIEGEDFGRRKDNKRERNK